MIAIGQSFWVFGGNCNFQFFNDLYKFTLKTNTWEKITYNNLKTDIQNIPIPRAGHTMEYYENFLVVFGGGNQTEFFDDLFFFDITTNTWKYMDTEVIYLIKQGTKPSPCAGHSFVKVSPSQFFLFGGGDLGNVFNNCFILDLKCMLWIQIELIGKIPTRRAGHSCNYYNNDTMMIFGGGDVYGMIYADLYVADFKNCVQRKKIEDEGLMNEHIAKIKEKLDKEHIRRMKKINGLKKYIMMMEKDEDEYYAEINNELHELQLDFERKETK